MSVASAKRLFCLWLALASVPEATAAETDSELLKSFRIAVIQPRHDGGPDRAGANGANGLPFEPGDYVDVTIEAVSQNSDVAFDHRKVSLYAKDQLMPNAAGWPQYRPAEGDPRSGVLTFKLQRDRGSDESKRAWQTILASPTDFFTTTVKVGVGLNDGQRFEFGGPETGQLIKLVVLNKKLFIIALVGLILAIIIFLWLARSSNMLRDTYPRQSSPALRRPFSLARCQMAWWFFIVISAYLFLILVTGDFNHALNEQTLVLIGIATGTALGSAFIDASKGDAIEDTLATLRKLEQELPAQIRVLDDEIEVLRNKQVRSPQETSQLEELAKKSASLKVDLDALPRKIREEAARLQERVKGNLFIDLVSDRTGVSVHRFQMIVWTLVLSMVFVIEVFEQLSMPEFSTTLLALMGISSGTYLGFKIPEQQA